MERPAFTASDSFFLMLPPIPLPELRARLAGWLPALPAGAVLSLSAGPEGIRVRGRGIPEGAAEAFAALFRHAARWVRSPEPARPAGRRWALRAEALLPAVAAGGADPFLVWAGRLRELARTAGGEADLEVHLFGEDRGLQERLRALSAYAYGTAGGVDGDAPGPWALRRRLARWILGLGMLVGGLAGGLLAAGWLPRAEGLAGMAAGLLLFLVGAELERRWMIWRSVPRERMEAAARGPLLRAAFVLRGPERPPDAFPLSGRCRWVEVSGEADLSAFAVPVPAGELASLLAPPEAGEPAGMLAEAARLDVPAPPPAPALRAAPLRVGRSAATGEPVGIDPDAHGMVVGGSRTGKSSFAFAVLRAAMEAEDPPGILLVDPHLSLADAFLDAVDRLDPGRRAAALRRLRILDPLSPRVTPLNLLTVPDFAWAGNALVQLGRRIWEDYWGPRMQAGLLGLFRIGWELNRTAPEGERLGLMHLVFLAYLPERRREVLGRLSPEARMGALALDALLGQLAERHGSWQQGWLTEVISPILSKAMALELSPWLFRALHMPFFADLERWVEERSWIVVRAPSGRMGREAARLMAAIVYNVWEAVFRRKAEAARPIPFLVVVDEAQEVAGGFALEQLLSEGAKFGARVFLLTQSLSMLREIEDFRPAVQALLASSSTQAFFSPDPSDAEEIRRMLAADLRYGAHTLDLPARTAWLRARIRGRWQPPALIEVDPLPPADPERVARVLEEVRALRPEDHLPPEPFMEAAWTALERMLPPALREAARQAFAAAPEPDEAAERLRRLGFEE
jgi:hypothetical protein